MAEVPARQVDLIRRFNRFYTKRIGALSEGLVDSPFSLAESRVLFELASRDAPTATEIGQALGLDAGYLSRILQTFERRGLVTRSVSATDGRRAHLKLTATGRRSFASLETRTRRQIGDMLREVPGGARTELVAAMHRIQGLLDPGSAPAAPYTLRAHRPGDMGWVVQRHGALYAQEHGYDEHFEALVASIVAAFIEHLDPARERCWIAERAGENIGCIFVVSKSKTVAKLRLLLVEPSARGLGLGGRLVDECVAFARGAGYRRLTLWTQSHLTAARHLYERAGFGLTATQAHHSFGKDLVAETWDLDL